MASPYRRQADWREDVSCETRLKVSEFFYNWTVHDFSLRREETGKAIESPAFSLGGCGDNNRLILQLYPNGVNEEMKGYVSLYVRDATYSFDQLVDYLVEYKFSVIDEEGQKVSVQQATSRSSRGGSWGFGKFIERNCLLKGTDRLLPNDKLTVYCEMRAFVQSVNNSSPSTSGAVNVPKHDLSQDLRRLLVSRRFSDVVLSVGGKEIHAHKNILAFRCPVFAAMFEHEMKENEQGQVEITDCDFDALHEVVEFIYTGRAPKLNEMAEKVLVAANKYDLGILKAMCEEILCSELSVGTAVQMLALADTHHADQLKANALRFIKAHGAGVVETEGWKVMASEKPHLAIEALCTLAGLEANESSA